MTELSNTRLTSSGHTAQNPIYRCLHWSWKAPMGSGQLSIHIFTWARISKDKTMRPHMVRTLFQGKSSRTFQGRSRTLHWNFKDVALYKITSNWAKHLCLADTSAHAKMNKSLKTCANIALHLCASGHWEQKTRVFTHFVSISRIYTVYLKKTLLVSFIYLKTNKH